MSKDNHVKKTKRVPRATKQGSILTLILMKILSYQVNI